MHYTIYPLGDQAVTVEFGNDIHLNIYTHVQLLTRLLDEVKPDWLIEYVPAYTTVTIFYQPLALKDRTSFPYDVVRLELESMLANEKATVFQPNRLVEIPVCYGGELGPDLAYVASYNRLTEEEVIAIHSNGTYIVYMLGFAPGFPYIGGMSNRIATPRRKTPRMHIPPRTVGIAGEQTGIYPIATPGGWQLIGQTPLELFKRNEQQPTLLQAGDQIRFIPISYEKFQQMEAEVHADNS